VSLATEFALGRYCPTRSPVHALDPRVKTVAALGFLGVTIATQSPAAYLFLTAAVVAVVASARLSPSFVLRSVASLRWLVLVVFVAQGFFTPGTLLFEWLPRFTREGAVLGAIFAWRIALMVTTATVLTATTSPMELGDGLERLLGPLARIGVPVHEISMISVIALRFVPTLMDETTRIIKAQTGRGARFDGGLVARARSAVPVLVPLFASALRRADDLALAMDARCYRGAEGRTKYVELRLTGRDAAAIVVAAVIVTCAIVFSR